MTISILIDELREEFRQRCARNSRYSLRAFARDIEISQATLSKLFNGKTTAGVATMMRISRFLGMDFDPKMIQLAEIRTKRPAEKRNKPRATVEIRIQMSSLPILIEEMNAVLRNHVVNTSTRTDRESEHGVACVSIAVTDPA